MRFFQRSSNNNNNTKNDPVHLKVPPNNKPQSQQSSNNNSNISDTQSVQSLPVDLQSQSSSHSVRTSRTSVPASSSFTQIHFSDNAVNHNSKQQHSARSNVTRKAKSKSLLDSVTSRRSLTSAPQPQPRPQQAQQQPYPNNLLARVPNNDNKTTTTAETASAKEPNVPAAASLIGQRSVSNDSQKANLQASSSSGFSLHTQDWEHATSAIGALEEENAQLREELQHALQRNQHPLESRASALLSHRVERLQHDNATLQQDKQDLEQRLAKLQRKCDNQKAIFDTATEIKEVELKIVQKERDILASRVTEIQHERQRLADEEQCGQALQIEALEYQLREQQQNAQRDLELLVAEKDLEQQSHMNDLATEYEHELEREQQAHTAALQTAKTHHESQVTALQTKVQELEAKLMEAQQKLAESGTATSTRPQTETTTTTAAVPLAQKLASLPAQSVSVGTTPSISSDRLAALRSKRDSLRNKFESMRSNMSVKSTSSMGTASTAASTAVPASKTRKHPAKMIQAAPSADSEDSEITSPPPIRVITSGPILEI